jgi:RecB family endonuclease NucS
MSKILSEFGMQVISPRVRARSNGHSLEMDVLAYSNSSDDAFVVEVKSHLREDALDQMRRILREFRDFFPIHRDKKVYGILAAVDAPEDVREKVLQEGIYLARIHDGQFELQVPDSFQPRAF